jgi:hypothetical protein
MSTLTGDVFELNREQSDAANTAIAMQNLTDIAALPGLKSLWTETLGDPRICIAVLGSR